jgi:predicted transcriptional regulator YdeE
MKYHDQIQQLSTDQAYYGACFAVEGKPKQMDYLAGMAVGDVNEVPEGLILREVPASRYAVFECTVKTALYVRPNQDSPKADFERYPPGTE